MTKRRLAAFVLVLAAGLGTLGSSKAQIGIPPGCFAYSPNATSGCVYFTDGGSVQIVALTTAHWIVTWGPFGNETANRCGEGGAPGYVGKCNVPAGHRVFGLVTKGVIAIYDRPGKL
jgi:hypothetical protein